MCSEDYPLERNLDGFYFFAIRNGKRTPRCFTDLTEDEQTEVLSKFNTDGLVRISIELAKILREVGDLFDIRRKHE